MAEILSFKEIEEQDEAIAQVEELIEGLDGLLYQKPTAKDLVKVFASGFVGGCSGALVNMWLRGFPGYAGKALGAAGKVVDEVGRFGLTFLVESKVTSEVSGTLDAVDAFISMKRAKSKAEKALLKAKKDQAARKQKYVEVEEG